MSKASNITILFPLCLSHSGSTLFSLLIGCQKNIYGAGELFLFSDRPNHLIQKKEETCSCNNEKKEACPFWSKVDLFLQSNYQITLDELNVESKNAAELKLHNEYLFEAISFVSKCNIIVDASKIVTRFVQLRDAGFKVVPILFKRDPCATVYSWTKRNYNWKNAATYYSDYYQEVAKNIPNRRDIVVTYESFIKDPKKNIKKVLDHLSLKNKTIDLKWDKEGLHILKGNAVRFQSDSKLKISQEWKSNLTIWQKIVIKFLAIPCIPDNYYFYYFWARFARIYLR